MESNGLIECLFGLCFLMTGLVADSTCPNNEGTGDVIKGLIYIEGKGKGVSLIVPRPCTCYDVYYIQNSQRAGPDANKIIISGEGGITVDYESPNCTVTIAEPKASHSRRYVFQRRNYMEGHNGTAMSAVLRWNYDLLVLATCSVNESLTEEGEKQSVATALNVGEGMSVDNNVMEISDYDGRLLLIRFYENFACQMVLHLPDDYKKLTRDLLDFCSTPPPPHSPTMLCIYNYQLARSLYKLFDGEESIHDYGKNSSLTSCPSPWSPINATMIGRMEWTQTKITVITLLFLLYLLVFSLMSMSSEKNDVKRYVADRNDAEAQYDAGGNDAGNNGVVTKDDAGRNDAVVKYDAGHNDTVPGDVVVHSTFRFYSGENGAVVGSATGESQVVLLSK